ncbi:hypothetical protein PR048_030325 [Dryococelus australis]|uniref:Uncharacterized protein n=1 Tax=Dryococelus australis TaxID=614101 RepID=A0ABQ9G8N7_9NEOP|nr:hypothetical protein PR048_030325 [Dryococelus australis]
MRVRRGEYGGAPECVRGGKRENPEKTRRHRPAQLPLGVLIDERSSDDLLACGAILLACAVGARVIIRLFHLLIAKSSRISDLGLRQVVADDSIVTEHCHDIYKKGVVLWKGRQDFPRKVFGIAYLASKGGGKMETPEIIHRLAVSSGTITTFENPGCDPAGNRTRFALGERRVVCPLQHRGTAICCVSSTHDVLHVFREPTKGGECGTSSEYKDGGSRRSPRKPTDQRTIYWGRGGVVASLHSDLGSNANSTPRSQRCDSCAIPDRSVYACSLEEEVVKVAAYRNANSQSVVSVAEYSPAVPAVEMNDFGINDEFVVVSLAMDVFFEDINIDL